MLGQAHHFLKFNRGISEYAETRYGNEAERLYRVLNKRLEDRQFVVDELTIADISIWPWVARFGYQSIDLADYPECKRLVPAPRQPGKASSAGMRNRSTSPFRFPEAEQSLPLSVSVSVSTVAARPVAELHLELDADTEIRFANFVDELARPVEPSQQLDKTATRARSGGDSEARSRSRVWEPRSRSLRWRRPSKTAHSCDSGSDTQKTWSSRIAPRPPPR